MYRSKGKRRRRPERSKPKRRFGRRPIEETVKKYVDLLRGDYDEVMVPLFQFYDDCRWESDEWDEGAVVIRELEKAEYEVRQVVYKGIFWDRLYIRISR